jgi:hypothetical protein
MPFRSEAQRRYLWKFHPEIAQRWSDEYGSQVVRPPKEKELPETSTPKGAEWTTGLSSPAIRKTKSSDATPPEKPSPSLRGITTARKMRSASSASGTSHLAQFLPLQTAPARHRMSAAGLPVRPNRSPPASAGHWKRRDLSANRTKQERQENGRHEDIFLSFIFLSAQCFLNHERVVQNPNNCLQRHV